MVVAEDSSFELARKPVSELEVIGVDSFDVQALVRPALDMEYLDEITIDIDEKCFANDLLERNIKTTEMESVDEIGIAGQPMPEKLEEYITEEVIEETTTTNLRNQGATRTTETVTETTTSNRRNLDNMGRKVIKDTSSTVTKSGRTSSNDNMGRKVIKETSTVTKTGRTSNNDNMGRKVIVESSQTTTTTTGNRFARGGDNMGRKVIVESSQTTTTTGNRFSKGGNNDNMGRKVIVESSQTTTTTGNRFSKGGNNDNMGRKVIVESTTVTRGGETATGSGSRFSAMKSTTNNDNMGRKVIVESSTTRMGETSTGSSRRGTHNAGYGGASKTVVVETTTTTTKGGYGAKKGGYQVENVTLNKSGSGSGSSYYKEEKKITKVSGGRKPWEVDTTNGDEVFAGRHPSDEEVSTGGNGYTKYSVKKEVKYQPTTTTKGATASKVSKFSVQRTGN